MDGEPFPKSQATLVILIGASKWPRWPDLDASEVFANSAKGVKDYFLDPHKFHLPPENFLDLFDSDKSADDIDDAIDQFLQNRIQEMKEHYQEARDILIYFIGHAGFAEESWDYYLAIRRIRKNNPETSGLRMVSFAKTVKKYARQIRLLVILDCCYAAAAFHALHVQGRNLEEVAITQAMDAFRGSPPYVGPQRMDWPGKGISLLCSSSRNKPSLLGEHYTEFSEALLSVLEIGSVNGPEALSLHMIAQLVQGFLEERKSEAPRPEVHSPDQSEGDIAHVPFFPNFSLKTLKAFQLPQPDYGQRRSGNKPDSFKFIFERTIEAHSGRITALAVSPRRPMLVSASEDRTMKLWNLETWELLHTFSPKRMGLEGSQGLSEFPTISSLAIHSASNDDLLACTGPDQPITLWDLSSGELLYTLCSPDPQSHGFSSVAFHQKSPSSAEALLVGVTLNQLFVWNPYTRELLHSFPWSAFLPNSTDDNGSITIESVAVSPDGKTFALCSTHDLYIIKSHWSNQFAIEQSFAFNKENNLFVALGPRGKILITHTIRFVGHDENDTEYYDAALHMWERGGYKNEWQRSGGYELASATGMPESNEVHWHAWDRFAASTISDDWPSYIAGSDWPAIMAGSSDNGAWLWKLFPFKLLCKITDEPLSHIIFSSKTLLIGASNKALMVWRYN